MRAHRAQNGLTLVEVLVALAILGLVASSIMALISQNTRFLTAAEERLVAGVLVDNEMTAALARSAALERGEEAREAEFGGRAWIIERAIDEPGMPGLVRIRIDVRDAARRQVEASATTLKVEGR
jgi:general secretion pathway protein I